MGMAGSFKVVRRQTKRHCGALRQLKAHHAGRARERTREFCARALFNSRRSGVTFSTMSDPIAPLVKALHAQGRLRVWSLVITVFVLRTLTWADFKDAVVQSMVTTVTILLIVAGAKVFGKAISLYRIPQDVSMFISQNFSEAWMFILVVGMVLVVMGLFLEALSMMLIMVPVLAPSLLGLGIDPIWFGVFFVIMIECALITPPVGLNLYVIQAVARVSLGEVARGVWPFLALMLFTVVVLYAAPDLALYIPFKW
jgi:C4-dicarboxylate transporter DctM subunit